MPPRGWHSTKLHTCMIAMGTLTGVYVLMGCPDSQFGEYCMAMTAFAATFMGSDVAGKRFPPPPAPEPSPPAP